MLSNIGDLLLQLLYCNRVNVQQLISGLEVAKQQVLLLYVLIGILMWQWKYLIGYFRLCKI